MNIVRFMLIFWGYGWNLAAVLSLAYLWYDESFIFILIDTLTF